MKIEKITVHGFRNIKSTTLQFDKILALISLNSFGKSNLLTAIDFGIKFITNSKKSNMMSYISGVPLNRELADEDFAFELEMTTNDEVLGDIWATYGYKFRWVKDDDSGVRILAEWLRVKKEGKGQKYSQFINRNEDEARYRKVESGRCDNRIKISPHELVINKLNAYDKLYFHNTVEKINKMSVYIERHLDADSTYQSSPFVRTDWDELRIENINDLPRAIYSLKEKFPDKYELLVNSYILLMPQIEDIKVTQISTDKEFDGFKIPEQVPLRIAKEIYLINVVDKNLNQPIDFEYMSDGAKRILLLLTCLIYADLNGISLVAIEEPDNCIHPSLLQSLLIVFSQMAENCIILITSHSPYLIQYIEPSNLYVGVPSNKGIAHFSNIKATCQKALMRDALDAKLTIGDYIFELMSGSEEDYEELNQYLECDTE